MSLNRRKFTKLLAAGATSATAASFFVQRPTNAYSINFLLSKGTADNIFRNFIQSSVAQNATSTLPSNLNPSVVSSVQFAEAEFSEQQFTSNRTPFAQRLGDPSNPIWGRQKQEDVGPNPGFATVQFVRDRFSSVAFSGATTVAIDNAIQVLAADEGLAPPELDGILVPWREQYQDWGTWAGDINPSTGQPLGTSLATYRTRFGEVIRRYDVVEPGPGGFGIIQLIVESQRQWRRIIEIRVDFA